MLEQGKAELIAAGYSIASRSNTWWGSSVMVASEEMRREGQPAACFLAHSTEPLSVACEAQNGWFIERSGYKK